MKSQPCYLNGKTDPQKTRFFDERKRLLGDFEPKWGHFGNWISGLGRVPGSRSEGNTCITEGK
jgi:hypothetical protein